MLKIAENESTAATSVMISLLKAYRSSKVPGSAYIDKQHYCKFPLLLIYLYVRMVKTGSNVPVYAADIITVLVLPDFTESNTTALECTMVLTGKNMPGKPRVFISILLNLL